MGFFQQQQIAMALLLTATAITPGAGVITLGELPGTKPVANAIEPASQHAPNSPPASAKSETSFATDLHGDPLPLDALYRFGTVRQRHGDAKLACGLVVKVPLFIRVGEHVKVDTLDHKYHGKESVKR